ncbi:hypothetical protein DSO57_1012836 [Entomophthora muscae]|uniref:Uncharacterized protein n=1 Tax=Entomophthora muscae TaxID=34485 RepID=A0ACC2S7U9_9FUNG|nr:hypothetical protein DSO57_1012836 [Entomophthora muscae]
MSGLPPDWTPYTPGIKIPDGFVLYQNTVIPLPAFNALSTQGFFQVPFLMPQPADKTTMPAYVAQRLCSAALEPFARANNDNAAAWIQSAQSKLAQMECPQQFWITEISICLTHDAGTWCDKWHKEHTDKNWDTFKQDFLARLVLKDTALMIIFFKKPKNCFIGGGEYPSGSARSVLMIIRQVKNLTQTGTVKELTRAYKELHLCAPSDMAFDTPLTQLMYYNALKLHVMRHVNLDQVTNLQSLYCEQKKWNKHPMLYTRHRLENKKGPRIPIQVGAPLNHLLEATAATTTTNPQV